MINLLAYNTRIKIIYLLELIIQTCIQLSVVREMVSFNVCIERSTSCESDNDAERTFTLIKLNLSSKILPFVLQGPIVLRPCRTSPIGVLCLFYDNCVIASS